MNRRLQIPATVSVLLHLLVFGAAGGFLQSREAKRDTPDKQPMIELRMVERQGAGDPSTGAQAPASSPSAASGAAQVPPAAMKPAPAPPARQVGPQPERPRALARQAPPDRTGKTAAASPAPARQKTTPREIMPRETQAQDTRLGASPSEAPRAGTNQARTTPTETRTETSPAEEAQADPAEEPETSPAEATGEKAAAGSAKAETPADETVATAGAPLEMNLAGTDSESNAIASGDNVIPAGLDHRAQNRPPVYPEEAARRGQQGAVVLSIHVSAAGMTVGSDVMQTSGFASLDEAAQRAVASWRFIPGMKDGRPVPSNMPMRFVFEFN